MSRTILASLMVVALAACGGGERQETAAADSLSRDLQLAPVDTQATLNDQPAATPEPAPPAAEPAPTQTATPTPARPRPRPAQPREEPRAEPPAPAPVSRSLAAGTTIQATTTEEISSRTNKVGDRITATVASDVKNSAGRVIVPAGSAVTFTITAIKESENKSDSTGTLTLAPADIEVEGKSYALNASIEKLNTSLKGRGTGAGDVAKVGAGAAAGAVVGRVLGGSTKGAVIGGIIGGAVGTQRAVETKDRDIVVPAGTTITMTLDESLSVGA